MCCACSTAWVATAFVDHMFWSDRAHLFVLAPPALRLLDHLDQVDVVVDMLKWDETKQTFAHPVADDVVATCAWNVMVSRRTVSVLCGSSHFKITFCMPPSMLCGRITAGAFFDSVFRQQFASKVAQLDSYVGRCS
jgi:hypothetical protein